MNRQEDSESRNSCPSCKMDKVEFIGKIPTSYLFNGSKLSQVKYESSLYKCKTCNLYFRIPQLSEAELNKQYNDLDLSNWQYNYSERKDWVIARNFIEKNNGGKILDIGCWDGRFLTDLSYAWSKFGIELNKKASILAQNSNINIIGDNLNIPVPEYFNQFDVVTAFDIIEHIADPTKFLQILLNYVRPGGYILLGTGNTSSLTWKVAKNKYWYCWLTDHITFINLDWMRYHEKRLLFRIINSERFCHNKNPNFLGLFSQTVINFFYLCFPHFFYFVRQEEWHIVKRSNKNITDPPSWNQSKDHILFILQKK